MRICGIACVKDAHSILAASIQHLSINGIQDFFICDHGSDPDLSSYLTTKFNSKTVRFRILRKESEGFFQQEMTNVMAGLARREGFDVAVVFDADEFWCVIQPDASLTTQIEQEMVDGIDALRVQVVNYAQHREVTQFQVESLELCQYAVTPFKESARSPQEQVDGGIPFLAMPFPAKVIARLRPAIRFTQGQHDVFRIDAAQVRIRDSASILVRHLPLSGRDQMPQKRAHGRRLIAGGFHPGLGWQSRRLADMTDEELDAYWDNNSWQPQSDGRVCIGGYDNLIEDKGLVDIGRAIAQSTESLRSTPESMEPEVEVQTSISSKALERAIEEMMDDYGQIRARLNDRLVRLSLAHSQAIAERNHVQSELMNLARRPRHGVGKLFRKLHWLEKGVRAFRKGLRRSR